MTFRERLGGWCGAGVLAAALSCGLWAQDESKPAAGETQAPGEAPAQTPIPETTPEPDGLVKQMQAEVEDPVKAQDKEERAERRSRNRNWGKEAIRVGGSFTLEADEEADEVIVILGSATIHGKVRKSLVVIGGNATVTGSVGDEMVVVLGKANLSSTAKVMGDVVVVGGGLHAAPGAVLRHQPAVVGLGPFLGDFGWMGDYFTKAILLGRPMPPQLGWVWVVAGIFMAIYLVLALLFPRPITACVEALENRPVGAFFSGVLAFIMLGPLVIVLVMSVAGILVIPLLGCALVGAILFGKAAVYRYAGQQFARQLAAVVSQSPLMSLFIGGLIFTVIYCIPYVGFLAWGALFPLAVGSAVLAAVEGIRTESASRVPVHAGAGVVGLPPIMGGGGGMGVGTEAGQVVSAGDEVSFARAGFWRRLCATVLDVFLVVWLVPVIGPFVIVFWAAYHIAMWTWKGTTIGGIVLGLKVVRLDGRRVDFATSLVRGLSGFFSAMVLFLGFLWAGWDRDKQSWHDKIAGTVVVKLPKGVSLI